jgi:hypothetical protein
MVHKPLPDAPAAPLADHTAYSPCYEAARSADHSVPNTDSPPSHTYTASFRPSYVPCPCHPLYSHDDMDSVPNSNKHLTTRRIRRPQRTRCRSTLMKGLLCRAWILSRNRLSESGSMRFGGRCRLRLRLRWRQGPSPPWLMRRTS